MKSNAASAANASSTARATGDVEGASASGGGATTGFPAASSDRYARLRILIAMGFVLSVIATHFNLAFWTFFLILVSGVAFFFIGRRSISKFTIVEDRFMANLNEKEQQQRRMAPVTSKVSDKMSRYNVKTDMLTIPLR